jgi:hypothetical protein
MVAFSSALAAAAAVTGTLEAALKHAPAALMKFNVRLQSAVTAC